MQRDSAYFLDILEAAKKACGYVSNISLKEFLNDTKTQDAVIRCIEIIGEASGRV